MDIKDTLTVDKVAEKIGVSERTIYALIKNGDLVAYRIGGKWRITENDIQSYIESTKTSKTQNDAPREHHG